MKSLILSLLLVIILPVLALGQDNKDKLPIKKRDPFVDLVDANGRIKTEDELFEAAQSFTPSTIILKGIIWDFKRPLAVINGKIYGEGAVIAEGMILEKIHANSVVLKTPDDQRIRIDLKKKKENK
ncbi:MAG: general secretion pathway protein GspB [Candidatus Omnitrophota bacterium]|nr:general secretion pathway protein GspB [Candidatus Omnitrophota bacterium]